MSAVIMESRNPANGKLIKEYPTMTDDQAQETLGHVHEAFLEWKKVSISQRRDLMLRAAEVLVERKLELAELATQEMGKVKKEGIAEVEKCAWVCRFYAEQAEAMLADKEVETDQTRSFVSFQPIGIVLAVMPWNFPFWQVFRFAAPTLMGGNAAVLKHASNVPGCALAIEAVFRDAGFPPELFRTLMIGSRQVKAVIASPLVRAVTLTGSTQAGRAVASTAGHYLKKTVLELGGSDPYIVMGDADLELAANACAQSRLLNSGQSCIAAKRFIVFDEVHDAFVEAFIKAMASKKLGDPSQDGTDLGPQASVEFRDELHQQVLASVKKGARCVLGGKLPDMAGAYYPATILTEVKSGMPAYNEELFGPVASVIRVKDLEEAVRVANDSEFGLGGGIFSRDIETATRVAREDVDTGAIVVNGFTKSDPRLPFGGVKDSGYGRELSHYGLYEFMNIKSVSVAPS
jgi:succinate-semialdehyde dehydrogenase / glutarate-semialdehyde dehydrogenase